MSDLGFIGIGEEYRLADFESISVLDAMMDANSDVRWVRINNKEFVAKMEEAGNSIELFPIPGGSHLAM